MHVQLFCGEKRPQNTEFCCETNWFKIELHVLRQQVVLMLVLMLEQATEANIRHAMPSLIHACFTTILSTQKQLQLLSVGPTQPWNNLT